MKILLAINTLGSGGAERVAALLADSWASAGHDVLLVQTYSGGPVQFYPISPSVRQASLAKVGDPKGSGRIVSRLLQFRRIVSREKPDIVVSFMTNVNVFVLIATAFQHVTTVISERIDPLAPIISKFLRTLCSILYPTADYIVLQSSEQRERISAVMRTPRRFAVIPNPLSPDMPVKGGGHSGSRKTLISLGRLHSQKRVDVSIDAFTKVAGKFPDWEFHIYGEGPSLQELQIQAGKSAFSERIAFKGRTEQAYAVLAAADAFVMSSDFEGFPNALIEAMAVGLPVVTSDCPCGSKEITRNGTDGLLFSVGDVAGCAAALEALMADNERRDSLGRRGAQSVRERFDLARILALWDKAFIAAKASA